MIEEGIAESSSLSARPIVDPSLATSASQLQTIGTNDAPLLGILGPTIATLGGTIAFFEGS